MIMDVEIQNEINEIKRNVKVIASAVEELTKLYMHSELDLRSQIGGEATITFSDKRTI